MACAMPLVAPMSAVAIVAEPPTAGVTVIVPEALVWMVIEVPASVVSVIVAAAIRSSEV